MKCLNWEAKIWLNCEQRVGDPQETIANAVLEYSVSLAIGSSPNDLHLVDYRTRGSGQQWTLFAYFNPDNCTVEVVDAAPHQHTELGQEWFGLVRQHFFVFGMPWRARRYEITPDLMLKAAEEAIDNLHTDVKLFLRNLPSGTPGRGCFEAQLQKVTRALDDYYRLIDKQPPQPGVIEALDKAVFFLHELIFDLGEALKLAPPRKRTAE